MKYLIKNATIINEGKTFVADVLIEDGIIKGIRNFPIASDYIVIDAEGKHLLPGIIDAQVHFREPGLIHKADIYTESKAAVAGGVTAFMEMPNTIPNALTIDILEEKYAIATKKSWCNYSFFLGISAGNEEEWKNINPETVCGITDDGLYFTEKGMMLCSNPQLMEKVFSEAEILIAIHSEDEDILEENKLHYQKIYGENIPFEYHPLIHSDEACFIATKKAIGLAEKFNTRLHILHLSTAKEAKLFRNDIPLSEKTITTEVCIHHLWFCDEDYKTHGAKIKWNPSIKTKTDREELWKALLDDRIDIITTDHAPHTIEEKGGTYFKCPSGAPMVQHSLIAMLEFYHQGKITLEKIAEKMCHNPALLYKIKNRGFIREGYCADLILIDLNSPFTVSKDNILYKCGWSPFEGQTFQSKITHTFVNGNIVYENGNFSRFPPGQRLTFYTQQ
ncbi:MAG: dihydroorotase [Bacteroidota bacterium]|nr:dihydroorotase [Bacteroidota bacterium]